MNTTRSCKHSRACINTLTCTWKCSCTQAKNYLPVGCVMMMVGDLQRLIECKLNSKKNLLRKKQILNNNKYYKRIKYQTSLQLSFSKIFQKFSLKLVLTFFFQFCSPSRNGTISFCKMTTMCK